MAKPTNPNDAPIALRTLKEVTLNPNQRISLNAVDVADKQLVIYDWFPKKSETGWEYAVLVAQVEGQTATFEISASKNVMNQLRDIQADGFPFQCTMRVVGKSSFLE